MKLVITQVEEIKTHLSLPDLQEPYNNGALEIELNIQLQANGNFSKYVKNGTLDNSSLCTDILLGKVAIKGIEEL